MACGDQATIEFDFVYAGNVGVDAQYQVHNAFPGQVNRRELQYQDKFGFRFSTIIEKVYHGFTLHNGNRVPASLITFELRFQKTTPRNRRVRHILLNLTFDYLNKGRRSQLDTHPEILKIDPPRTLQSRPCDFTTQTNYGVDFTGNEFGGPYASRSRTIAGTEYATLSGSLLWGEGRIESGPMNAVEWVVDENPVGKNGVPQTIRVAVLVRRNLQEKFCVSASINAHVDMEYKARKTLQSWFGKPTVDDPVTFDPSVPWPFGAMDEPAEGDLGAYLDSKSLAIF